MQVNELEALYQQAQFQLSQLSETVQQLRQALDDVVEENNRLRITNQDLRALANEHVTRSSLEASQARQTQERPDHGAQERLQSFYDEGIHICHQHFGQRRDMDEGCLFCLGILGSLEAKHEEDVL